MQRKLILLFLVMFITCFIFLFFFQSADISEGYSLKILNWLKNNLLLNSYYTFLSDHILRKIAHWFEFCLQSFGLCVLCVYVFKKIYSYLVYILFLGLLTAVIDENIQLYVPGRSGMVQDILIDFIGTMSGVLVFIILKILLSRRMKN